MGLIESFSNFIILCHSLSMSNIVNIFTMLFLNEHICTAGNFCNDQSQYKITLCIEEVIILLMIFHQLF